MSSLDYLIIVVYLAGITSIGLLAGRKPKSTLDEYFLGSRAVPWLFSTSSLIATGISCRSLIGLPGLAFKGDLTYLQMYLPLAPAVVVASFVFLPFYVRLRMTSVYEYIGIRFGLGARSFASALFQIQTALITGTVIAAPSLVLSEVTGLSYAASVTILMVLTVLYTAVGGTKGLIWTDVAQLAIFVGVPVAIGVYICQHADGGLGGLYDIAKAQGKLQVFDFSLNSGAEVTFWAALLSMTCWHLANFSVNQENSQRYLTAPSERDCRRTMIWGGMGILLIWALLMVLGVMLYAFSLQRPGIVPAGAGADRVFPAFVLSTLPVGFKGFFISAALAAGMSTLASMVNAMGTATLLDFWKVHFDDHAPETKWISRARLLTLMWGVISFATAFIVLKFGTVITAGIKIGAVLIGAQFGMFLLGIFSARTSGRGAMVGAFAGIGVLLAVIEFTAISWSWYCLIGTGVTCVAGWIASFIWPLPAEERPLTWAELRRAPAPRP